MGRDNAMPVMRERSQFSLTAHDRTVRVSICPGSGRGVPLWYGIPEGKEIFPGSLFLHNRRLTCFPSCAGSLRHTGGDFIEGVHQ